MNENGLERIKVGYNKMYAQRYFQKFLPDFLRTRFKRGKKSHISEGGGVGSHCTEKMENDYINPKKREKTLRNKALRRKNFMKKKVWTKNINGDYVLKYKGYYLTVTPSKYYPDSYGVMFKGFGRINGNCYLMKHG